MKQYYKTNPDFKAYVDKYACKHGLTAEEALSHKLIKEVYLSYKEAKNGTSK